MVEAGVIDPIDRLTSSGDSKAIERNVTFAAVAKGLCGREIAVVVNLARVVGIGGDGGADGRAGGRPVAGFELGNLKRSGGGMQRGRGGGAGVGAGLFVELERRRHVHGRHLAHHGPQGAVEDAETQVDGERDGHDEQQMHNERSGGLRGVEVEVGGPAGMALEPLHKRLGLFVFFGCSHHWFVELWRRSSVQEGVVADNV